MDQVTGTNSMSWQTDLINAQQYFKFEPMDAVTLAELDKLFRSVRPGPWKMTWNRNAANYSYSRLQAMNEFLVHIVFENEQDEVWWLLQNGD